MRHRRQPLFNTPDKPMGGIGFPELIIIFLVLLLVFGAKRIPEIARGIGKGIREFKSATNEISREIEAESQDRQINQPQAPQQGAPQPRQGQQQRQQQSPQQPSPDTAGNAGGTSGSSSAESSESTTQDSKETS
jgi:sec-independent protein translocase protein TatA